MNTQTKFPILINCCLLFGVCLLLTGCWDRHEVAERNFVLAAGIDVADAGLKPGQDQRVRQTETFVQSHGEKKYRLSLQILDLRPSGGEEMSSKGGETKTYVVSNTGQSLFEMDRDMLGQVNKHLWWEHTQTIILSEAVVKEVGLKSLLDWFLRNHEMRWRMKIFITPGEARPLLEYQPPNGEPSGIFFAGILRNHFKSVHLAGARTDLGWANQSLDNDGNIIIPRIEMAGNVVKVNGVAIFKKDKFVGYFDEYAVAGGKYINGTAKSAIITTNCPEDPEKVCVFELFQHDTKLTPHVTDGKIYFTLDIDMAGNLAETQSAAKNQTTNPEYIQQLEKRFAEEVKRTVEYTLQTERTLGVDVLRFSGKLQAFEPEIWEKVKDQWDEIFPTIPVIVSVNVTIKNIGEHK